MDSSLGHLNGILARVVGNLNNNFQKSQMPGALPGGACWSFDLTDTLHGRVANFCWKTQMSFILACVAGAKRGGGGGGRKALPPSLFLLFSIPYPFRRLLRRLHLSQMVCGAISFGKLSKVFRGDAFFPLFLVWSEDLDILIFFNREIDSRLIPSIACVASVSVRFRRKERGTRVKDREKSGASTGP